jgi:hypothetical protein
MARRTDGSPWNGWSPPAPLGLAEVRMPLRISLLRGRKRITWDSFHGHQWLVVCSFILWPRRCLIGPARAPLRALFLGGIVRSAPAPGLPYRNYYLKPAMDRAAASTEESQIILLRLLSAGNNCTPNRTLWANLCGAASAGRRSAARPGTTRCHPRDPRSSHLGRHPLRGRRGWPVAPRPRAWTV